MKRPFAKLTLAGFLLLTIYLLFVEKYFTPRVNIPAISALLLLIVVSIVLDLRKRNGR